jgi:hypothetical protein
VLVAWALAPALVLVALALVLAELELESVLGWDPDRGNRRIDHCNISAHIGKSRNCLHRHSDTSDP